MFRALVHPFLPFLESPLERIVDDRIDLLRISLEEVEVKNVDRVIAFVFSLSSRGRRIYILVQELFGIFDIFKGLFEIVLTALAFLVTFLNKFQGAKAESTFAV